jgi:photosystem II stability/assembly factor-like uncharacterized protein
MKKIIFLILFSINLFSQTGWYKVTGGDFNSIRFVDSLYGWAVGGEGTVIASTNGGNNWVLQERKTTQKLTSVFFVNRNIGWIVGLSGTILKTTNGGTNWSTQFSGTNRPLFGLFFIDENNGWIGTDSGRIIKTTNGGIDWTIHKFNSLNVITSTYFFNKDTGWITDEKGIWKTTDGGMSWSNKFIANGVSQLLFTTPSCGWAKRDYGPDPYVSIIYKTTDGGENWASKYSQAGASILYAMTAIDTTHVWLTGYYTEFHKTSDGGEHWGKHSLGVPGTLRSIFFINKNIGWAAGSNGIYKTIDGGSVTSVKLEELPTEYALYQNYPNPFNPVTTINYQIPVSGMVRLKVYNVLGKEVRILVNEEKSAGSHSIEFNASNLSSGIYIYELRSNEFTSMKKLILIK